MMVAAHDITLSLPMEASAWLWLARRAEPRSADALTAGEGGSKAEIWGEKE